MSLARSRKHWRQISILYFLMMAHWLPHTLHLRAPRDPSTFLGCELIKALAGILWNDWKNVVVQMAKQKQRKERSGQWNFVRGSSRNSRASEGMRVGQISTINVHGCTQWVGISIKFPSKSHKRSQLADERELFTANIHWPRSNRRTALRHATTTLAFACWHCPHWSYSQPIYTQ